MSIDPGFIKVNDWPILLMVINHKKNVSVSLFKNVRLFVVVVSVIHSLMSIKYNINRHYNKSYGDSLESHIS